MCGALHLIWVGTNAQANLIRGNTSRIHGRQSWLTRSYACSAVTRIASHWAQTFAVQGTACTVTTSRLASRVQHLKKPLYSSVQPLGANWHPLATYTGFDPNLTYMPDLASTEKSCIPVLKGQNIRIHLLHSSPCFSDSTSLIGEGCTQFKVSCKWQETKLKGPFKWQCSSSNVFALGMFPPHLEEV